MKPDNNLKHSSVLELQHKISDFQNCKLAAIVLIVLEVFIYYINIYPTEKRINIFSLKIKEPNALPPSARVFK